MSREAKLDSIEEKLNYFIAEAMFAVGQLNEQMTAAGVSRADRRNIMRAVTQPDIESVYVPNHAAARDAIRGAQHELAKARLEV